MDIELGGKRKKERIEERDQYGRLIVLIVHPPALLDGTHSAHV